MVSAHHSPLRVLVWPKLPTGSDAAPDRLLGARSNLQIPLDSGLSVTVELKIAPRALGVQRVVFAFPERQQESRYVRDRLRAQTRKLEAAYQERFLDLENAAQRAWKAELARGMLTAFRCTDLDERTMTDLVVLRVERLCQFGAHFVLMFSVQNRGRSLLLIDRIEVESSDGAMAEAQTVWAGTGRAPGRPRTPSARSAEPPHAPHLRFDETRRGAAGFSVKNGSAPEWTLRVLEKGGRGRVVREEGLGF